MVIVESECTYCHGTGFENKNESLNINIKGPIKNGYQIKYDNLGNESKSKNGKTGDLYVQFIYKYDTEKYNIKPSYDIIEKIYVPYYDCILGCTLEQELPTKEKVKVHIPKYTKDNDKIIIQRKSLYDSDYIYEVHVKMPTYINSNEKTLLEKIKKEEK